MEEREYNIGDEVRVGNSMGIILLQLGKETDDPKEVDWYEIEFDNGNTDHYPVTEILYCNEV